MSDLTHWKKFFNPNYLGAYSLQPGEERTVTILKVQKESVKDINGKSKDCTVAHLKGEKPMILNKTNCRILTKIYDTPYIEDWVNKQVIIHAAKVDAFGEQVDALRIKPIKPENAELTPDHPKWKEAVKALAAGKTTIDKIAARYTLTEENRELLISEAI